MKPQKKPLNEVDTDTLHNWIRNYERLIAEVREKGDHRLTEADKTAIRDLEGRIKAAQTELNNRKPKQGTLL